MTVGVADEGPEQYEPPRLAPGSPPAPAGRPRPLRGDRLFSTNERHFPHGGSYESVVFWHPDTFLTTYFETDLEAYAFVAQELDAFAREARAELRP